MWHFKGKPFRSACIEMRTFDELAPKSYAPFNRFSDGGTAFFLGFLQGQGHQGTRELPMLTDIRLHGLPQEYVLAPPLNQGLPGGDRGYAYFGPARTVHSGPTQFLIRFNIVGLAIVPLWRAMMEESETKGEVYSASMIDAIVLKLGVAPSPSTP